MLIVIMPGGIGLANPQFPYKSYFDPIGEAAPSSYTYDVTTKNQFALRSFKDDDGNCFTDMVLMSDGADSTSTFRLFTNTPEGNAVERMTIPSNGTIVHSTGTTVDSSYLNESPGFTTDHFIYTRAIVNEPETGTGPAAIVFGNGATYGTDEISLITGGNTRMYIRSNGNVGIGTTSPAYKLELSQNSAAKPTSTAWTVSSDQRIKEDIVDANLDTCYENVKNLKLKYYKLRDDIIELDPIFKDAHKLGWIAQEVEEVFPKCVTTIPEQYGLTDVKNLDVDQIYTNLFGAVQKLIKENENLKARIEALENRV